MIRFYKSVLTESPLDSPFVPKEKNIAPLVVAGLVAAGASIANNIANNVSVNSSNNTQWDIANLNADLQRETNEQNKQMNNLALGTSVQMNRENNAFTEDMWNKQNAYNDPRKQVERLLAAGINPAGAQSNLASSVGASGFSSPSQHAMVAPQFDPHLETPRYDFSGVGDAMMQVLQMKQSMALSDSQINYTNAKAEFEWQSMQSRLQDVVNRAKVGSVEYYQAKENLRMFKETYDFQKKVIENNALMSDKFIELQELNIAAKTLENDILSSDKEWRDKMNAASYIALLVGIKDTLSHIALNRSEQALNSARIAVEEAREKGMKISNEQADQLVEIIVDKAETELVDLQNVTYRGRYAGKYLPADSDNESMNRSIHENKRKSRHLRRNNNIILY